MVVDRQSRTGMGLSLLLFAPVERWAGKVISEMTDNLFSGTLTLWRALLPYGNGYKASSAKPSFVIFDIRAFWHSAEGKGAFHQRLSNLSSAEPGSTLIVDLYQVQVMMRSTNVKLGSADVVQLNHDGYTSWTLIGPIWSRLVTSHVLFTLVLGFGARAAASSERVQPVVRNVFLALILWLFYHHGGEIWGWSDSTVTHLLLLKMNKIKITVITHSIAPTKLILTRATARSHALN